MATSRDLERRLTELAVSGMDFNVVAVAREFNVSTSEVNRLLLGIYERILDQRLNTRRRP